MRCSFLVFSYLIELSRVAGAQLKSPPKSKGILEQIMALYQSGFEGEFPHIFVSVAHNSIFF
jgi:hypothetical protein